MSKHYSPKIFFRQSPNHLLKQYFTAHNVLSEVDFDTLAETQIEPIYEAWLKLPENIRNKMEQDFQEINDLATAGVSTAILDEARFHGEDLSGQFAGMNDIQENVFWTFLERPKYWAGALAFHHADTVPSSYWRKRKNLPQKPPDVDPASIRNLEETLGHYFHTMQGRGRNCKVDCYKRNELDYFFAYPEDYAQASIEWEEGKFNRRPHHPAFEIIFVFSQKNGTLDTYLTGDRKLVPDLQEIFANTILKAELGPDKKDERVYDLALFQLRDFQFIYGPEAGIEKVVVKKIKLKIFNKNKEKITLEVDSAYNKNAIFDLLDKTTKDFLSPQISISQVGIKVTFIQNSSSRRAKTRTFDITWPNSCSLKHDGRDLTIRKMLVDSGIEPKEPSTEDDIAV